MREFRNVLECRSLPRIGGSLLWENKGSGPGALPPTRPADLLGERPRPSQAHHRGASQVGHAERMLPLHLALPRQERFQVHSRCPSYPQGTPGHASAKPLCRGAVWQPRACRRPDCRTSRLPPGGSACRPAPGQEVRCLQHPPSQGGGAGSQGGTWLDCHPTAVSLGTQGDGK